jgi:hypothetical protein
MDEALAEVKENNVAIEGGSKPTYLPYSLYAAFTYHLEKVSLPWTRFLCYVEYTDGDWKNTDVNDVVEKVGFEDERAQEVVQALQAIAPYPARTLIVRDQIAKALRCCEVFPEHLREEHEAAASRNGPN